MNRGADHQRIFFCHADRLDFGRRMLAIHRDLGIDVLAYCLMDNHFHLILKVPGPGVLSVGMQHLLGGFTQHTNALADRDGPLLRGRFHSIPVETDAYLVAATSYVHRNPVDIAGGPSLVDYRWSSLGAYVGERSQPVFLDVEPVMGVLGNDRATLIALAERTDGGTWCPPEPTLGDIRAFVACALVNEGLTGGGRAGQQNVDRTVMALISVRTPDPAVRTMVERHLAHRSMASRTRALQRARARFTTDPVVRRIVLWVEEELTRHTGTTRSV